jgi:hypothetical protein
MEGEPILYAVPFLMLIHSFFGERRQQTLQGMSTLFKKKNLSSSMKNE